MLEWGMATEQPGSLVRDSANRPVFTGSEVCSINFQLLTGRVVKLVDTDRVEVLWNEDSLRPQAVVLSPAELRVLRAFPRAVG